MGSPSTSCKNDETQILECNYLDIDKLEKRIRNFYIDESRRDRSTYIDFILQKLISTLCTWKGYRKDLIRPDETACQGFVKVSIFSCISIDHVSRSSSNIPKSKFVVWCHESRIDRQNLSRYHRSMHIHRYLTLSKSASIIGLFSDQDEIFNSGFENLREQGSLSWHRILRVWVLIWRSWSVDEAYVHVSYHEQHGDRHDTIVIRYARVDRWKRCQLNSLDVKRWRISATCWSTLNQRSQCASRTS